MLVRQAEIELPGDPILKLWVEPHFQKTYDPGFASFDPATFLVNALPPRAPRDASGAVELFDFIRFTEARLANLSGQQRVPFLLQETAWAHEIEHFHDCIATTAGFTAFLREWLMIMGAVGGLKTLRDSGWAADARIAEMAAQDSAAADVLNYYGNLVLYRLVFNGDVPAVTLSNNALDYDVVWGRYNLSPEISFRIPFFPSNATVDGVHQCLATPLGFRAMTEFRALAYQSHIIRSFGQEYVDGLLALARRRPEYASVNMMVTRVAKRYGIDFHQPWYGDAMFSLVGAALARDAGTGVGANPAASLIELLEEIKPDELPHFTRHEQNVAQMRQISEGAFLQNLPLENGDWFGIHHRDFGIQFFREALRGLSDPAGPDPFPPDSISWYSTHLELLPRPPLSYQNGRIGWDRSRGDGAAGLSLQVTSRWIILRTVLEQAMMAHELRCAVLDGPYSGFLQQATPHEYCPTGISQGGCGACRHGDSLPDHPECTWKVTLIDLGLARR